MSNCTLSGTVQRVQFYSEQSGYLVLRVRTTSNQAEVVTVASSSSAPSSGSRFSAQGEWIEHPKYGRQFQASSIVFDVPLGESQQMALGQVIEVEAVKLVGTVERITFYNPENGYTVLRLDADDAPREALSSEGLVTIVGTMPELAVGERVEFSGRWTDDPRYGRQLRADQALPIPPQTRQGIVAYLIDQVRGVGERTAQRIYDFFGEETMTILEREPQRVAEVPGLKPQIVANIVEAFNQNRVERQVMIHLQSYGISARMARKIYNRYRELTLPIVTQAPYQLADEVDGIGFKRADSIALRVGLPKDAPQRLKAGLAYTLSRLALEGHTFAPRELLLEKAASVLEVDNIELLSQILQHSAASPSLGDDATIFRDTLHLPNTRAPIQAFYLPIYYKAELQVVRKLYELNESPSPLIFRMSGTDWESYLGQLAAAHDTKLTPDQQEAVKAALSHKISVLTGGPGTGKTTTLKMVIEALEQQEARYALASPTGRAAKRLAEATGRPASTIHRLLEFSPLDGGFERDEDNPLDVAMLIIDESSMLDLVLFYVLLRALPTHAHLMLVGDVDQLPSVGAGNVLKDVINSGLAQVTRLNLIFRQDKRSTIALNAHRINQGGMPLLDNSSEDFYFFNVPDAAKAARMVVDVTVRRLPERFGYDPMREIQVIAPMYRGSAGVEALNTALQSALNGQTNRAHVSLGGRLFRVGDRVMQTKNNYEKEVFNGDIGILHSIDRDNAKLTVVIDENFIDYEWSEAEEQLIHAYCISTHRSQGSEYPVVVLALVKQHHMMLQRNLLYTAITRAKKIAVIVGDREAVELAVNNNKVAERYSGLLARLRK
ncbi:MAG: ATP-dependent RecD-like DNA helicase [Anaerolineae bacterium]|nr:ATP-dependent RecD-like DNA helicase [Anaerolineae bacterium]MDW8171766.1 ATP-dependent RecD-like DNA helicase [Anaerolineae bacterium]